MSAVTLQRERRFDAAHDPTDVDIEFLYRTVLYHTVFALIDKCHSRGLADGKIQDDKRKKGISAADTNIGQRQTVGQPFI